LAALGTAAPNPTSKLRGGLESQVLASTAYGPLAPIVQKNITEIALPSGIRLPPTTPSLPLAKTQRVLLQAKDAQDLVKIQTKLQSLGIQTLKTHKIGRILVANVPLSSLQSLSAQPEIQSIWADLEVKATDDAALTQINTAPAWENGLKGDGIKIAVLDTGIDATHPSLAGKVIANANFSDSASATDRAGHGTHVAGIIVGNGTTNGVAPNAKLLNAKVLNDAGSGTMSSVIAGINWAIDQNVRLINLSLGATTHDADTPLNLAIQDAINRGIIVVVAAGNCGGCGACNGFSGITMPGNTPQAITVGAVDSSNSHACFSSGESLPSGLKPDLVAPGVAISSSLPNGSTGTKSGTSMATPFVTGSLALALQKNPTLSANQVQQLIAQTATDLGASGKDTDYGWGLLNASRLADADANTTIPDTNSGPIDQNNGNDTNVQGLGFSFDGPTMLYKRQQATFAVNAQLGSTGLASQDTEKDTIVEFAVFDEFGNMIDLNVVGPVELVNFVPQNFPYAWNSDRTGHFRIQATVYIEGQSVNVFSANDVTSATSEKNVTVTVPSDLVQIQDFNAPTTLSTNQNATVRIELSPNPSALGDASVDAQDASSDLNALASVFVRDDTNAIVAYLGTQQTQFTTQTPIALQFDAPLNLPAGHYSIETQLQFEDQQHVLRQPLQISAKNILTLQPIAIPTTTGLGSTIPLRVRVQNHSDTVQIPILLLKIQNAEENAFTFLDVNREIPASGETTYSFDWTPTHAGTFDLNAELRLGDDTQHQTISLHVTDTKAPLVEQNDPAPSAVLHTFFSLSVSIHDESKIAQVTATLTAPDYATQTISLQTLRDSESGFSGAFTTLDMTGEYAITVNACDEFGNCQTATLSPFTVIDPAPDCRRRQVLRVEDDDSFAIGTDQETVSDDASTTYCASDWRTSVLGSPSLGLLKGFDAVWWNSANRFGYSIDPSDAQMLEAFSVEGGKLFVFGSDVSSEHAFDSFAQNALHATFENERSADAIPDTNTESTADWWNPQWQYRTPITVTVPVDDTNTIIAIDLNNAILSDTNAGFWAHETDGNDVRFTDSDNHELRYSKAHWKHGFAATFFVDANTLVSGQDNTIYLYFRNPAATNDPSDATIGQFFSETFSDREHENNPAWNALGGSWDASEGYLRGGSSPGAYIQTPLDMDRTKFEYLIRYSDYAETLKTAGMLNYLSEGGYVGGYEFYAQGDIANNQNHIALFKNGFSRVQLYADVTQEPDFALDTWHQIQMLVQRNGEHHATFDGETQPTAIDGTIMSGHFLVLATVNAPGHHRFDNIYITRARAFPTTLGNMQTPHISDPEPSAQSISMRTPNALSLDAPMVFDANHAPHADSIAPDTNTQIVAKWADQTTAMTAYENPGTGAKTVFAAFALSALTDADQKTLVDHALDWLLERPNTAPSVSVTAPQLLGAYTTATIVAVGFKVQDIDDTTPLTTDIALVNSPVNPTEIRPLATTLDLFELGRCTNASFATPNPCRYAAIHPAPLQANHDYYYRVTVSDGNTTTTAYSQTALHVGALINSTTPFRLPITIPTLIIPTIIH
jgi:subtilisin family serine protease